MTISLEKGQRISLEKDGDTLKTIALGVNWGSIEKKGLFGSKKTVAVDLDASIGLFDAQGDLVETIYFGHKHSKCGSIHHSGDDLTGDTGGDDGIDNEVIQIDLARLPNNIERVALILNSFRHQDFADIPYANVRIHDGKPEGNRSVFARFDIANDSKFAGSVSMIIGSVYRHNGGWKFSSIGEPTKDRDLRSTLQTFRSQYAN